MSHKQDCQDQFNNRRIDVLVGQIAVMGVSLNLQHGGNRIVVVEEDWSPAIMDQFYARLHRIGQTDHVHVDILQSDDKLSKAVAAISAAKRRSHAVAMEV
jgi:SNF2 family DNA or RNA helicase